MIVGKTASEIFDSIRHLVQSGALKPGDVLPPVRELAGKLSLTAIPSLPPISDW
ncbi:transcriptional regulatory protein PtsJ [Klebsiella michiganensis]|uniref:Transcriptional regulatory protein PtsJ n=1 Tax=Klebsiella michiganensis TaxID=1134687 RepID=A0A7H4MUC5_9ENTR|nr:transcriptional regulatory protein PtsJ [Klebsiella michiganensis]